MIFPSSWPQTDDVLVITQIYLSLTPRSDSFSVCKAGTPIHLWALHTSIQIHHQVTEGTTRPCCSCQLHMFPTPSMVPGAPFQPTWGWIISLCPSWRLFSSPLSGPATQKSLELSLHKIHLTGGPSGPPVGWIMNSPFAPFWCPCLAPYPGSSFAVPEVVDDPVIGTWCCPSYGPVPLGEGTACDMVTLAPQGPAVPCCTLTYVSYGLN